MAYEASREHLPRPLSSADNPSGLARLLNQILGALLG
jgi:hypothetical protein